MSGALLGISAAGGIATQALRATGLMPAMFGRTRKIGTIIPDVTIEESHSDRVTFTQHPVAVGSPVHDHAYRMPATVTMRLGFSNANVIGGAVQAGVEGFAKGGFGGALESAGESVFDSFTEEKVRKTYKKLLDMQFDQDAWEANKAPLKEFTLTTGKRTYKNMVITEISVRTDRTTEYSLMVEVHMQEVFFVKTSSTTQPSQTDQKNPSQTASPTDQAGKSAAPVKNPDSLLVQGGFGRMIPKVISGGGGASP